MCLQALLVCSELKPSLRLTVHNYHSFRIRMTAAQAIELP